MPAKRSPEIPSNPSPQLQTVLNVIDAIADRKPDVIESLLVKEYVQDILPRSMGAPSSKGREAFVAATRAMVNLFTSFEMEIHEITEGTGKVIVHCSDVGDLFFGYHYANEYIFTFYLAQGDDGVYRVTKTKEFADSKATLAFFEAVKKHTGTGPLETIA